MGPRLVRVGCLFVVVELFASISLSQQLPPKPLITQPVNESQLTTLRGNTHPLALPQFDIGTADPGLPLNRMLLVLRRSPQQDFALRKMLDDQQDKASPNYHKWLTPDQFGVQFGPSDQDLQLVSGWLRMHGFQINRISRGRTVIEFSGNEGQVESAFHTQIHKYLVNGEEHWANAGDPEIPAALAPAIAGVLSLHDFPRKPMNEILGAYSPKTRQLTRVNPRTASANPQFTIQYGCYPSGNCYAVGPADFGAIYNVQSLWNSGIDGTGQKIAIVGESDINVQDARDFRTLFGLPAKDPTIIYDGPNPGLMPDESEADIDVQWAGAIAPNADINFVVAQSTETSAGVDLSAIYIIDNNLAPVMSESYGFCELGLGPSGNQFYASLWAQAASQGITVILASGDQGSAGCDFLPQAAQYGLQVSGFASTPFNVAVGGTDFDDFLRETTYWNTTNTSPTQESAKGYIPETTWNLSCTNTLLLVPLGWGANAENNCNNPQLSSLLLAVGGSGGVSKCTTPSSPTPSACSGGYAKPSWQVAPGVPADNKRDIPDVSLFASNGVLNSFYIFCQSDSFSNCSFGQYGAAGGTSFGAPAFAGIMALVNQSMQTPQGQGNANYVLYKLAGQQTASNCNSTNGPSSSCVFNDITSGTIAMPCFAGSPNCTVKTSGHQYGILNGYATGTGFDLATGLGSINVANLVSQWSSVSFRPTITTLTLNPTSNLVHGQAVTVTGQVKAGSGTGTPTGTVSLLTSAGIAVDGFTLSGGSISGSTNLLPGGTYTVTAHYAGDPMFGGSDSPPVSVTVGKENSTPQIRLVTFDWQGNLLSNNASTAVYGSPYLLRVNVLNGSGLACSPSPFGETGCPTGNIVLTDNGSPLDAGTYALNSLGYAEDQAIQLPGGNNTIQAQYGGDSSYNASSTTTTYSLTPAPATISAVPNCCYIAGVQIQTQVTVQSQSSGAAPGGTVTFYANGAAVPGTVNYQRFPGSFANPNANFTAYFSSSSAPFPVPGSYTLSATYGGDGNYAGATSQSTNVTVKYPTPNFTVTPLNPSVNAGNSLTLTALVHGFSNSAVAPTGTVQFFGNGLAINGVQNYQTVLDANGNPSLQATLTFTPAFNEQVYAKYNGDANYPGAQTFPGSIAVVGNDFGMYTEPSSITVIRGQVNLVQLIVAGQSGYNGSISFDSNSCAGLPRESTCSFTPATINGSGGTLLTISAEAPHRAAVQHEAGLSTVAVALFGILLLPVVPRGRNKKTLSLATMLLLISVGCGGGSSATQPPPNTDPGTPKGSYTITVTGTAGSITHTATFTLVVQ